MVTRVETITYDDLDGSTDDVKSVRLALDGVDYEMDLCRDNRKNLEASLAEYLSVARRVGGKRVKPQREDGVDVKDVRQWAVRQGIPVQARGRVSKRLVERYLVANSAKEAA